MVCIAPRAQRGLLAEIRRWWQSSASLLSSSVIRSGPELVLLKKQNNSPLEFSDDMSHGRERGWSSPHAVYHSLLSDHIQRPPSCPLPPRREQTEGHPAASPILAMTSISYQHGLWALLELESVPVWPR